MSELKIYFELSQGAQNKMYTLWRVTESTLKYNRVFIQNLSIDKEQALIKAKELAGKREVIDDSFDKLSKIIRSDSGLISFGKYKGTPIIELVDNYLTWVAQGAPISEVEDEYSYTKLLASEFETQKALEEAIKRNLFVEFEGEFIPLSLRDYILESRKGWGYHFNIGEKVQLQLQCIKITGFENQWGYTNIYTFKETSTGNKFQYKGVQCLEIKHNYIDSSEQYSEYIKVGDCCTLKGTVKLEEYKGQQITYLQRIKVLN